jgi:hypothetical protein
MLGGSQEFYKTPKFITVPTKAKNLRQINPAYIVILTADFNAV